MTRQRPTRTAPFFATRRAAQAALPRPSAPGQEPVPGEWETKMTPFQRLCFLRTIRRIGGSADLRAASACLLQKQHEEGKEWQQAVRRPDRIQTSVLDFVTLEMGRVPKECSSAYPQKGSPLCLRRVCNSWLIHLPARGYGLVEKWELKRLRDLYPGYSLESPKLEVPSLWSRRFSTLRCPTRWALLAPTWGTGQEGVLFAFCLMFFFCFFLPFPFSSLSLSSLLPPECFSYVKHQCRGSYFPSAVVRLICTSSFCPNHQRTCPLTSR